MSDRCRVVRLHRFLLRRFLPSLGDDYAAAANEAFASLDAAASRVHFHARTRLWWAELRALARTAIDERRAARDGSSPEGSIRRSPDPPPRRGHLLAALEQCAHELRHAVRQLTRSPGFSIVAILSLTFAMFTATAVFSVVNAALLRPIPGAVNPERLVRLTTSDFFGNVHGPSSYPDFLDIRAGVEALEDLAAYSSGEFAVNLGDEVVARLHAGQRISPSYFDVLGVRMLLGRPIRQDDLDAGDGVVVIGYRLWQEAFGGDAAVLGRTMRVFGKHHTIVGVAPEGLTAAHEPILTDLWVPVSKSWRESRGTQGLLLLGRLRAGATLPELQSQVALINARLVREHADYWQDEDGRGRTIFAMDERAGRLGGGGSAAVLAGLAAVSLVVGLVMTIACANVAILQLARALRRRGETAVKLALGASRGRIIGRALAESVVLSGIAAGAALALAHWVAHLVASGSLPLPIPATPDFAPDARIVLFTALIAFMTALLFGIGPALQGSRPDLLGSIKSGGTATGGPDTPRLRNALVTAQVAASVTLLVLAGVVLRGAHNAAAVDPGFDATNVALLDLDLGYRDYDAAQGREFHRLLRERLLGVPGVEAVASGQTVPYSGLTRQRAIDIEGYERRPGDFLLVPGNVVSEDYFRLMDMPLVLGRAFRSTDRAGAPMVAIVNEAFASTFWPEKTPLGRWLEIDTERGVRAEVVGVVRDARHLDPTTAPVPRMWVPMAQQYVGRTTVHVRTAEDPRRLLATMRETVQGIDADMPLISTELLSNVVDAATLGQRMLSFALAATGVLALALAMMGIYGVMAYAVEHRTREVGLRLAIGARADEVVRMIVKQGLLLVSLGIGIGLWAAVGLSVLIASFMPEVNALDLPSLLSGVVLLAGAAVVASLLPARRAARVDPADALRAG